jgi:hypothetical protein
MVQMQTELIVYWPKPQKVLIPPVETKHSGGRTAYVFGVHPGLATLVILKPLNGCAS